MMALPDFKSPSNSAAGVPLFLIEEHHEAYYVFHYAMSQGYIPRTGNVLLHVDEHSDMSVPREYLEGPSATSLDSVLRFTYRELGIATFLWPAISAGIVEQIHWLRRRHTFKKVSTYGSVWPQDESGRRLASKYHSLTAQSGLPVSSKTAQFFYLELSDALEHRGPIILDIDLDFFGANQDPTGEFRIEVSEAEYKRFQTDPYHCLRLLTPGRTTASRIGDRCFLVLFSSERREAASGLSDTEIADGVIAFVSWLRDANVQPAIICVCRSVRSGYTPAESADQLLAALLRALGTHIPFNLHRISDIVPAATSPAVDDLSTECPGEEEARPRELQLLTSA